MLKRIIEKVVVLEGGRGVKCVVKREERKGRAAMLMQDVACAGVPFFAEWRCLNFALSLRLLPVQRDAALPLGVKCSPQSRSCRPPIKSSSHIRSASVHA